MPVHYSPGATTAQVVAGSGELTSDGTAGASYILVPMSATVNRLGAEVVLHGDTGTAGGSAALVLWGADFESGLPAIPEARCHWVFGGTSWALQIWPSTGAAGAVTLATGSYPAVPDGVSFMVEAAFDGDTAYLLLPDGSTAGVTDPRIESLGGTEACWEIYRPDGAPDLQVGFRRMWASTEKQAAYGGSGTQRAALAAQSRLGMSHAQAVTSVTEVFNPIQTTSTEVDPGLRVAFVAPASGRMLVDFEAHIYTSSATTVIAVPTLYDYTGTGTPLQSPSLRMTGEVQFRNTVVRYVFEGLTPGGSYVVAWNIFATNAGVASVYLYSGSGAYATAAATPVL